LARLPRSAVWRQIEREKRASFISNTPGGRLPEIPEAVHDRKLCAPV
jgi:hypothetical protein